MDAAREAATAILEEEAARSPEYRRVYDPWRKARQEGFRWFNTAELAYESYVYPRG
jgi:TRAP-type mannitol/chloroaromatic compound transport system substrate-binding protein